MAEGEDGEKGEKEDIGAQIWVVAVNCGFDGAGGRDVGAIFELAFAVGGGGVFGLAGEDGKDGVHNG